VSGPHRCILCTAIDMSSFRDRSWPAKPFYQPCRRQSKARLSTCRLIWQAYQVSALIVVHVSYSALRVVANMLADNVNGGNICYRLSKTAVNQLTKTVAVDLAKLGSKVITLAIHPGYLPTKMNDYYGENDMAECISGIVKTVEAFGTVEGKDIPSGGYVDWNGKVLAL
jgi:NAD(P)-dependent dehydrogenase (short-subunit alcohol dehydrogenase family)